MADYVGNNVLPSSRVRSGRSVGSKVVAGARYSPESVDPLQACGGFNSVVELAASTCRQHAGRAMQPVVLERTLDRADLNELLGAAAPTGVLAQIPPLLASLAPEDYRGFRLRLEPAGLTFADAGTAVLSFAVTLSFTYRAVSSSLPETPVLVPIESWDPTLPMESPLEAHAPTDISTVDVFSGEEATPAEAELRGVVIGHFLAELRAPLIHRDEPERCRTRVFADLRRADWSEALPPPAAAGQPTADVLLVHDACFSDWLSGATSMLHAPLDLPLTPTLSLVGSNPGAAPVPEITDFEVRAFAVFDSAGFDPALAVAFDVAPGCHGVIEDVSHFIGANPYGVISDEFLVDRVFHHRWDRGGFDRELGFRATLQVTVTRDGEETLEDAIVSGYQELETLDYAAITTDANTRSDCIAFGGQARVVPTWVRLLSDGQTFGARQVDFDTAVPTPWSVRADVEVKGSPAADPEIRDFQAKAQRDGARPIAAPFAFDSGSELSISYARVEGVTRYVFFLGNISGALT